jgi:hypothetical protein
MSLLGKSINRKKRKSISKKNASKLVPANKLNVGDVVESPSDGVFPTLYKIQGKPYLGFGVIRLELIEVFTGRISKIVCNYHWLIKRVKGSV